MSDCTHLVTCEKSNVDLLRSLVANVGRYFDEGRCAEVTLGPDGLAPLEPFFADFRVRHYEKPADGENYFYASEVGGIEMADLLNRTWSERKTLEQVRDQYPDARIVTAREVIGLEDAKHISSVLQEESREDFIDALECLPPLDWSKGVGGQSESFKMSEAYSYNTHFIHVRMGKEDEAKYFKLCDLVSLKHDEIMDKVRAAIRENRVEWLAGKQAACDSVEP